MAQWGKLLASVGIGAAKMTVTVAEENPARGSELQGQVELNGGEVSQQVEQIFLSLGYTTMVLVGKVMVPVYREVANAVIAEQFEIAPNETKVLPFAFELPEVAPNELNLTAKADIPGAVDPTSGVTIHLTASREMLLVQEAMQTLGFTIQSVFNPHALYTGRFVAHFVAPESLQQTVEGIAVWLKNEDDHLIGEMEVNHQEQSFADTLKAMVRLDRNQSPLTFSWSDLYNEDETPRTEHLAHLLQEAFKTALELPDGDKATLLRAALPASSHSDSNELLRSFQEETPQG